MKDKKSSQLDMYRIVSAAFFDFPVLQYDSNSSHCLPLKHPQEKLNAVGFKWSLQNYTVVSWEDRFEVSNGIDICVPFQCAHLWSHLLFIRL